MPANIAKDAYGYLAVYVDKPAWHGLGTLVQGALSAEQVIKVSRQNGGQGLGYVVETAPAYAKVGSRFIEAPEHRAIVRKDTREVFGFGSGEYRPIQNVDALRLPEAIVRTKQAGWVSAGAIGNGAKLFATLDLSRLADIKVPGDPSKYGQYLVITWAHDATEALRIAPYTMRVECANMRAAFLGATEHGAMTVRITHTGNVADKMDEARRILGFAEESIKLTAALYRDLAAIPVPSPTKAWLDSFLEKLVPIPTEMERPVAREQARSMIAEVYAHSKHLHGVPASAYRVLQAVDEYADHYRPLRVSDMALVPEKRFRSLTEGPAADLKTRALDLLREEFEVKVPVLARAN